jgi:hypothetical protein
MNEGGTDRVTGFKFERLDWEETQAAGPRGVLHLRPRSGPGT